MTTKRKLVYITHGISVGGAELAMLTALPSLFANFDLRVIVLGKSNPRLLEQIDAPIRKNMSFWNLPSFMLLLYLPAVCVSLACFKPDIIISSLWRSAIPAVIHRRMNKRATYIILLHSAFFFHRFDRLLTCTGMKYADAVFADSTATKSFAERFVEVGKSISVLSYLTMSTPRHRAGKDFGGKFSFFFMGSLNAVKRVPLAIKALAWLHEKGLDVSLHVYGRPGSDEIVIRRTIAKFGLGERVKICGEILPYEKNKVYRRHNCYIQLSAHEGMAMSVVEAMQHGMLCVVTPVGEIPNYTSDGENAVLMDVVGGVISEYSLRNLLAVLNDRQSCEAISSAAHRRFKNAPVFADSLVEALRKF